MNRTDRLLAIVLEFQAHGWRRAEDLAAHFEISKRTIYRDMQALGESGVPVISEPGRGYALVEGYFLPPLHFTTDEAILLLLGGDWMRQTFDDHYRRSAESAITKITAALPDQIQEQVRERQSRFRFISSQPAIVPAQADVLKALRRAIVDCQRVHFAYFSRPTPHEPPSYSERDADPYALVHFNHAWYLVAHCHLRDDIRHFRLDRIEHLRLLRGTFERPTDFSLVQEHARARPLVARVLFTPEVARWVQESPSFYQVTAETRPDGLLVTLHVRGEEDILPWLLSWGAQVRILEPESLRQRFHAEIRAMLQTVENPESLLP